MATTFTRALPKKWRLMPPLPRHAHPHTLLSDRELEVFRLLTSGQSVNAIATQLAIGNKTVSTHKTRLLEKLNLCGMAELMRYAMQHDLLG